VAGLSILLVERGLARQREIYLGNLQWSMFGAICKIGGGESKLPSYGDICEKQNSAIAPLRNKEEIIAEYDAKTDNMLEKYQRR